MMRTIALKFVKSLTRFNTRHKAWSTAQTAQVNVGSDLIVADGWINLDSCVHALIAGFPDFAKRIVYKSTDAKQRFSEDEYVNILKNHTFLFHNVEYGLPFPSNSVRYLYSSHVLEHLYKEDAIKLLTEAYRVLTVGGRIRLCIPDLAYAISLYEKGDTEAALAFFFDVGDDYFYTHKYMYDFELLRSILARIGFTDIVRCPYRVGEVPDTNVLDNRPDETLFVEAVKGSERRNTI